MTQYTRASIQPATIFKHGYSEAGVMRADIKLNRGRVSDALRVCNGPCVILAMFMEITEAVSNAACNMSWKFRSNKGGTRTIGDTVSIQNAALGDFFYAECDGSAIIKATTSTGLITAGTTYGAIVT